MVFGLGRYRKKIEIVRDILQTVLTGAGKTRIMYQCNLSYKLLKRYLEDLKRAKLLRVEKQKDYLITKKGELFLKRFEDYTDHAERVNQKTNKINNLRENLEGMLSNKT